MRNTIKSLLVMALGCALFSCNSDTTRHKEATDTTVVTQAPEATGAEASRRRTLDTATLSSPEAAPADTGAFQKKLSYKDISFDVKATGRGSLQQVTVQPQGLTANDPIVINNSDPVVNAEVADLNGDSFPELLIYTQSAGSGSYGKIHAYSVNKGKSVSAAYFPPVSDNATVSKGYMGHDKFTVANNKLTQSFPLYKEGDANSAPTGKQRTITYKLVDGEASRKFVVEQVTEQ